MVQQLESTERSSGEPALARPSIASLPAKGSCWYCDQAVDNVRRFCSPSCRSDYLEEEAGYSIAGKLSVLPGASTALASSLDTSQAPLRSTGLDSEAS